MIKVAIAGATGYTGGELIRILLNHPDIELKWLISTTSAGEKVSSVHRDLLGECNLTFTDSLGDPDVLFMALGHGLSRQFLSAEKISGECKVIDLGNDFRLDGKWGEDHFVYGLSELLFEEISRARFVANPGCFATSINLALAPLAQAGLLKKESHVHAITGSTGAGKALSGTSHFSYRENNISIYKPFTHQHLAEIGMTLDRFAGRKVPAVNMVPLRGDFTRGILASIYTEVEESYDINAIKELFKERYSASPFVIISEEDICLKEVINTNKAMLHIARHGKYIHITSIIDNLLKGASGQAVQNMNIMLGLPVDRALKLKGIGF